MVMFLRLLEDVLRDVQLSSHPTACTHRVVDNRVTSMGDLSDACMPDELPRLSLKLVSYYVPVYLAITCS